MQRRVLYLAGAAGTVVLALVVANAVSSQSSSSSGGRGSKRSSTSSSSTAQPALPGMPQPDTGPRYAAFNCASPAGDAARVDGAGIPLAELCNRLRRLGAVTPQGTERVQARAVLERMIDARLVRTALDSAHITVTKADVVAAMGEMTPRIGAEVDLISDQLRERLEVKKLIEQRTKLTVTDHEVDAEILDGAPGIDRGQGVRVDGYISRITPGADENVSREHAEAFADGDKTADAAAKQKLTPLAPFVVSDSGIEPELQQAAFGLGKDKWSGAVRTRVGWAVIRVLEAEQGEKVENTPSLRARVRRALETRKLQGAQQRLLDELRAAARIEYIVTL